MSLLVYDSLSGKMVRSDYYNLTNHLWEMRNTRNPWEVIEEVIKIWGKKDPTNWKSYIVRIKELRDSRKVTTVGTKQFRGVSRDDKKNGAMLSYTLDIPEWVIFAVRKLYNSSELVMDKEFFNEFARRFPAFKVRSVV